MIETIYSNPNFLAHHGIKGQEWGVRRYQNEDGTLTAEGRKRYGYAQTNATTLMYNASKEFKKKYVNAYNKTADYYNEKGIDEFYKKYGTKADPNKLMEEFSKTMSKTLTDDMISYIKSTEEYKDAVQLSKELGSHNLKELDFSTDEALNDLVVNLINSASKLF